MIASAPARLLPTRSVDKRCARWPGKQRCIHKNLNGIWILVFLTKPAETDRLQDFENRNNTIFSRHCVVNILYCGYCIFMCVICEVTKVELSAVCRWSFYLSNVGRDWRETGEAYPVQFAIRWTLWSWLWCHLYRFVKFSVCLPPVNISSFDTIIRPP